MSHNFRMEDSQLVEALSGKNIQETWSDSQRDNEPSQIEEQAPWSSEKESFKTFKSSNDQNDDLEDHSLNITRKKTMTLKGEQSDSVSEESGNAREIDFSFSQNGQQSSISMVTAERFLKTQVESPQMTQNHSSFSASGPQRSQKNPKDECETAQDDYTQNNIILLNAKSGSLYKEILKLTEKLDECTAESNAVLQEASLVERYLVAEFERAKELQRILNELKQKNYEIGVESGASVYKKDGLKEKVFALEKSIEEKRNHLVDQLELEKKLGSQVEGFALRKKEPVELQKKLAELRKNKEFLSEKTKEVEGEVKQKEKRIKKCQKCLKELEKETENLKEKMNENKGTKEFKEEKEVEEVCFDEMWRLYDLVEQLVSRNNN